MSAEMYVTYEERLLVQLYCADVYVGAIRRRFQSASTKMF